MENVAVEQEGHNFAEVLVALFDRKGLLHDGVLDEFGLPIFTHVPISENKGDRLVIKHQVEALLGLQDHWVDSRRYCLDQVRRHVFDLIRLALLEYLFD